MIIIGERINGMFNDVKKAIVDKDEDAIKKLALEQEQCGANILDINVGPATREQADAMKWLVQCVESVSKLPLALDNPKLSVISEVIPECNNKVIINSTKADPEPLMQYIELCMKHNAGLIGLTMDASGIPSDVDTRVALGATVLMTCLEAGMHNDDIFIDPIILPVNCDQQQPTNVMEMMRQLVMLNDPRPHIVLGLSNVSQGTPNRSLINRIYCSMAIAAGLDSAILDPMDKELMDAVITAEMLLGKQIYCDSYLTAYYGK